MIQNIKSYFIRKRANELRKSPLLISFHDYEKSYYNTCEVVDTLINTPTEIAAYRLSETDGFKKSPEHYWLEAEKTIEQIKEYKTIITNTFINYAHSLEKQFRG